MQELVRIFETLGAFFQKLGGKALAFAPAIAGGLVILLVGYVLGRLLAWGIRRSAVRIGLDRLAAEAGPATEEGPAALPVVPSDLLARLGFWLVMLTAILAVFDVLGVRAIAGSIARLLAYLPNLFGAVLVLLFGLFLAQAARTATSIALRRMALDFGRQITSIVYYAVVIMTVVIAAGQLKIDISAFQNVLYIVLGAASLFVTALVAWGARTTMEDIIAGYYLRRILQVGDHVKSEGGAGIVELVDNTHTHLRNGDETIHIPNARLFGDISRTRTPPPTDKRS